MTNASLYNGNASAYGVSNISHISASPSLHHTSDWTLDKGNISVSNSELAMLLTETNGGTRLSSTRYVHYGTITATCLSFFPVDIPIAQHALHLFFQ